MAEIVAVQFARLAKRLETKNIHVVLDESAKKYLAAKGFDSIYGARPLKRVIQKEVENLLAEKILQGEILENSDLVIAAKETKEDEFHIVVNTKSHL